MKLKLAAALTCLATSAAAYDEATESYVESNVLGIFYHEMGHALIDILELPIFGQEEDAADVLSVFLVDAFFEEDTAVQLAYDTAFGFYNDAEASDKAGYEVPYWDVHGPDLQRYYNLVCLFYGANPDERDDVAEELGLPEERADYCPDEYDQAAGSWGNVLDDLSESQGNGRFVLGTLEDQSKDAELMHSILSEEISAINEDFSLPFDVPVGVEICEEANAFYDPNDQKIIMCIEFVPYLAAQYQF